MSFVLYRTHDTIIVDHKGKSNHSKTYATERAAKSARTKACKVIDADIDLAIAEVGDFYENIELQVERMHLMTGKPFTEGANTPNYCSPAREAYFSM